MSLWSRIFDSRFLLFLAVVSAFGISSWVLASSLLGKGNIMGVTVGDCFDEIAIRDALASEGTSEVELVDCSEPHDFEVFHIEELAKGDFPGEIALAEVARNNCEGEYFENFIGVEYLSSEIYSWSIVPQSADWEESGSREIVCYIGAPEGALSGTLEGINR